MTYAPRLGKCLAAGALALLAGAAVPALGTPAPCGRQQGPVRAAARAR
ncbi:hypothetical protein AB0L33_16115 [Streptomyces sp. NPDC052299]